MTLKHYLREMHKLHLRDHMEKPMTPFYTNGVDATHQSPLLPNANRSKVPERPEPGADLSWMNSKAWLKAKKSGGMAKPGNRRKVV